MAAIDDGSDLSGYEVLIALSITGLLINLTLLVRIKFGNLLVTHLSVRPYIISLCLLAVMLVQFTILLYLKNISYADDIAQYWKDLYTPSEVLAKINVGFTLVKIDLVLYFIMCRTYEHE